MKYIYAGCDKKVDAFPIRSWVNMYTPELLQVWNAQFCTCIKVILGHAQLILAGIACRLRLAQSIVPSCKSQIHSPGHTHTDSTAAKRAAAFANASRIVRLR